jgi:cryptochrome
VYSPIAFGKKMDPTGVFIRKYLPVLAKVPDQYIYEPWLMPESVQKKLACIIGKDYPKPIIEHETAKRACLDRISQAYQLAKANKRKRDDYE